MERFLLVWNFNVITNFDSQYHFTSCRHFLTSCKIWMNCVTSKKNCMMLSFWFSSSEAAHVFVVSWLHKHESTEKKTLKLRSPSQNSSILLGLREGRKCKLKWYWQSNLPGCWNLLRLIYGPFSKTWLCKNLSSFQMLWSWIHERAETILRKRT